MEIKETLTRQVGNDIITCTDERATALVNGIMENNSKGIDLYFSNCELIKELRDTNGYYLLGYANFKELAEALFDSGETQAKNMCLVAKYFGKENSDKSWTIIDKELLKKYSATQLLYIGQLHDFDGSITECATKYGFSPKTTCAQFRELVKFEKNHKKFLSLEDVSKLKEEVTKEAEPKASETTAEEPKELTTEQVKAIKESKPYKDIEDTRAIVMNFASEAFLKASDSKVKDKEFREWFKSAFKTMEKAYNGTK